MAGDKSRSVNEQDVLLSGGSGKPSNSARAGFIPVGVERIPVSTLHGIAVYVRVRSGDNPAAVQAAMAAGHPGFCLYCAQDIRFAEVHRRRLLENGVKFLYIRMADHARLRAQTEATLGELAADSSIDVADKSAIIYDTSVELVNELLADPDVFAKSPRLERVCRAVTTLVINNEKSFSHLFAASHHDFYTATHMVNVATWMVPLAYELGHQDPEELNQICQAGMMHDMGKVQIPESVLNKRGKLTDSEWAIIRRHPEAGCEYLARFEGISPTVMRVTGEHHERLDGSGYPRGLRGDQIHAVSKICAVVDSFDAMTAFRPFKSRTFTVPQALEILESETPSRYDPRVMAAWLKLIRSAADAYPADGVLPGADADPGHACSIAPGHVDDPIETAGDSSNRRQHDRKAFHCPARTHLLVRDATGVRELPSAAAVAHNISSGGLGLLSQRPFKLGDYVRVYLQAPGWSGRALNGQTVRCRKHKDSWHEIGLQFAKVEAEFLPDMKTAA